MTPSAPPSPAGASAPTESLANRRRRRRRERWEVAAGLRRHELSSKRVAACGHRRVSHSVEVRRSRVERDDGSTVMCATFSGLLRCGSVWECPVCAGNIRAARTAEVRQAVHEWGHRQTYMLTLTVRHRWGEDLHDLTQGVANAYRRFVRGEVWKRIAAAAGVEHWIRALEITHGENGWHPHLHVLWLTELPLGEEQRAELVAQMQARWQRCVCRELGVQARPNAHGVRLTPCRDEDYITKFALELVDPAAAKAAGRGHRTPWEIAVSAAAGDARDGWLWRQYAAGIRGLRMLTWSRGLREFAGLGQDVPDEDLADELGDELETVCLLPGDLWDYLRHRRHLACTLLEAAELAASNEHAERAIDAIIRAMLARRRACA